MPHHVVAYNATAFNPGANVEGEIQAITDNQMTIQNSHIIPQRDTAILAAVAMGATITRGRLQTPKLLIPTTFNITPLSGVLGAGAIQRVCDIRDMPLMLRGLEELQVFITHTAAVAEQDACTLYLDQGQVPAPPGDMRTIRGTAAGPAVANSWTNIGTITWQNTLPTGLYSIVGGFAQSATGLAWRCILENQFWRPGAPAMQALTDLTDDAFRFGGLGQWGTFHNTAMPQIEFLSTAADAAFVVALDIIKIG